MGGPEEVGLICSTKKLTLYPENQMEMFKVSWKLSEVFCFVFAERRETKMETHWTLAITSIGMGVGWAEVKERQCGRS